MCVCVNILNSVFEFEFVPLAVESWFRVLRELQGSPRPPRVTGRAKQYSVTNPETLQYPGPSAQRFRSILWRRINVELYSESNFQLSFLIKRTGKLVQVE